MDLLDANTTEEQFTDQKLIIYQIFTRLFGNQNPTRKTYGTKEENGVGTFDGITDAALRELKQLGVTHVWYTGVIEHALMTDYSAHGIPPDDADVVKGRAGSPYAIKDYYDVNPDLATDIGHRMAEFEALVKRTHDHGLGVLIDFVPNHVARRYSSDAKPAGVEDLGEGDDPTQSFGVHNNFYYLPGQRFRVPKGNNPLGAERAPGEDGGFDEFPAKASGNDVFSAEPGIDDWFETTKLNYGVDLQNNRTKHFDANGRPADGRTPVPATWTKMHDILAYWTQKGVDGFRCDMAEMVPVEFWGWVIPRIRQVNPAVTFTAEIYNPAEYRNYIYRGRFDFLYDKVGLYDTLRRLMEGKGNAEGITHAWREETRGIATHMLRFLENHDEQRIASRAFAGDPRAAVPAMTVSATLGPGPVMVYFGQEVGEKGEGNEGFGTEDGRTTIFDYWGVPAHQQWMNGGRFDGGGLDEDQKRLRQFYATLLNLCTQREAIRRGQFYSLQAANEHRKSEGFNGYLNYAYLRFTPGERLLVVVNFDRQHAHHSFLKIPREVWAAMGLDHEGDYGFTDLLNGNARLEASAPTLQEMDNPTAGLEIRLPTWGAGIFLIEKK
ncbi:MAG: alpha-amylase [Ferruginibacter sp.]|nr:alpha-amylase [Cytophagales bacterium]